MLLLTFLACAPPPLPAEDPLVPSITITWPPPESDVEGCETVAVTVENFTLVETPSTDENAPNEGHYHIYHPKGYTACYKPYCFVDLSGLESTTEPFLTAVLTYTDHTEILDEEGDRTEDQIAINFIPGDCTAATGDTGGGE